METPICAQAQLNSIDSINLLSPYEVFEHSLNKRRLGLLKFKAPVVLHRFSTFNRLFFARLGAVFAV
jgi:hypothetical protein